MNLCNSEIIKRVKWLEQEKANVLSEEERICYITYQTEADKIDYKYSFENTREKIAEIDRKVRNLKHLLNQSNATTIVREFGMTLGECLVYMSQLNSEKYRLEQFARKESKTRRSTVNGVVEYTELNYNKEDCKVKLNCVLKTLSQLQMAIDRTNLTNLIKVEEDDI